MRRFLRQSYAGIEVAVLYYFGVMSMAAGESFLKDILQ